MNNQSYPLNISFTLLSRQFEEIHIIKQDNGITESNKMCSFSTILRQIKPERLNKEIFMYE